jgi:hypothetical protein
MFFKLIVNSLIVRLDIFRYNMAQYAAPGGNLAQLVAIFDQMCAIERKFKGFAGLGLEPQRLEYEVVRDLVIGITDKNDPRLDILGTSLTGKESVILFDLQAFGSYVKMHTEYEVQNTKVSILQLIRTVIRGRSNGKNECDLVALIGGADTMLSRIIYTIIGLAGLWAITILVRPEIEA